MENKIEILYVGDKIFSVGCNQTGVIIEEFATLKDAKNALIKYEEADKGEGVYESDFYEIRCKGELINNL
jgi:hypothetical protein